MNSRLILVALLVVTLAAVVVGDLRLRQALAVVNPDRQQVAGRLAALAREVPIVAEKIQVTRARRDALRKSAAANQAAEAVRKNATANPGGPAAAIANDEELRKLRVRTFVAEERLKFAADLYQLGLTPEQLQRFDAIAAEHQEALLDMASTAKAQGLTNAGDIAQLREEIDAAHEARLKELFGEHYAAWQDANRKQGTRNFVDGLLQLTFPSGGQIDAAQTQALVDIAERHTKSSATGGYDWEGLANDAPTVLSGPQLDAFRTALNYRQASEKMNAVARGAR